MSDDIFDDTPRGGDGRELKSTDNNPPTKTVKLGVNGGPLRSFIERIERLEEEKKAISDDIREVYVEAKGTGFDTKTMREMVRLRKRDSAERAEQEALRDLYAHALGIFG